MKSYEKTLKLLLKLQKQFNEDVFSCHDSMLPNNISFHDLTILNAMNAIKLTIFVSHDDSHPDYAFKILPKAHLYFLDKHKDSRRYWIPIIISVIALIKSFFPQLVSIWKLITQLWKQ